MTNRYFATEIKSKTLIKIFFFKKCPFKIAGLRLKQKTEIEARSLADLSAEHENTTRDDPLMFRHSSRV